MKVKPLKNHLLVQIVENEKQTKSGIILTGTDKSASNLAIIKETADCYDDNGDIFIKGDKILINSDSGVKLNDDGNEYLIINQKDVLAIINH